MHAKLTLALVVVAFVGAACGDPTGTNAKIETVDALLARVCQIAAQCPGLSSTQAEIDNCPLDLKSQLAPSDLSELQAFTTLAKDRQDAILECIRTNICGRFGGSVANISDSDLMEPYRDCLVSA